MRSIQEEEEADAHIRVLKAMADAIPVQDNACTAHPVFVVIERLRVYGIDLDHGPNVAWVDTSDGDLVVASASEVALLREAQRRGEDTSPWAEVGYEDIEVPVTTFFTRSGAEEYIHVGSHRHKGELHVYVDSAHRNAEQRAIRWLLERIGYEPVFNALRELMGVSGKGNP